MEMMTIEGEKGWTARGGNTLGQLACWNTSIQGSLVRIGVESFDAGARYGDIAGIFSQVKIKPAGIDLEHSIADPFEGAEEVGGPGGR